MVEPGLPSSWFCASGISYIGIGVATALVLAAVFAAALVVLLLRRLAVRGSGRGRPALERLPSMLLLLLATLPAGYAVVATAYAASLADPAGVRARYPDGLWWAVLGPAAIVVAAAALATLLTAGLPWHAARVACGVVASAAWLALPWAEQGLAWVTPLSLALVVASLLLESPPRANRAGAPPAALALSA